MSILFGLVFTAVRYKDLPVGRALHSALIAAPAVWLTKTPPQRIAIIMFLPLGAALLWIELGPLLMAADYSPILWFADMSLYLDAVLTVTVVTATVRAKSTIHLVSGLLRHALGAGTAFRRGRARSSSPRRPKQPPSADQDAPGFGICLAA